MTLELLVASFPEEPPVGSIVLDDKGAAWQRYSNVDKFGGPWRASSRMTTWVTLLSMNLGGVTLVHLGGGQEP